MSNMAYCRFENTLKDLQDCYDNMDYEGLSESEENCKNKLITLCEDITEEYGNL